MNGFTFKSFENRGARSGAGFTLIELLIVIGLLIIVGGTIIAVERDLFSVNNFFQETFSEQLDADAAMQDIVSELRSAAPSSIGSYPIEIAASNSIAFYSNVDKDFYQERVQYFLSGTSLMKSVVKPAGAILTYATTTASETLRAVLKNLVASSTTMFSYYDKNYAGTTTPLASPVNVLDIRLVRIMLSVDKSPGLGAPPVIVSSQVEVRNLKDNL